MNAQQTEIFNHIKKVMVELFEIDEAKLLPSARLYEELDIDSIDAVDLLIELKGIVGQDIKPEDFTQAETLEDIVNIISQHTSGT